MLVILIEQLLLTATYKTQIKKKKDLFQQHLDRTEIGFLFDVT